MLNVSKRKEPLVKHIYTADPSAHVFEDKLYIYVSHDLEISVPNNLDGDHYAMEDYHVLTMDDRSAEFVDHGEILHMKDVPWVSKQMWAPDAGFRNGKYYFYFPARDLSGVFRIGVATADSPAGPFTPEADYMEESFSIDPAVFNDDDDEVYLILGGLRGGQLEKWSTDTYMPDGTGPAPHEPALGPRVAKLSKDMLSFQDKLMEISIIDTEGRPILAGDEERRFFEGPWMHKYEGKYYLSYSTGNTHKIVYAIGDNPLGPFTFQGTLLTPVIGWTTHHSIVNFRDKWYLFYHDSSLSDGVSHKRCVKVTELKYNADGTLRMIDPNLV
ncbi:glycoside hydrolase family 43 protein [Paenibacillus sp. FSL R7-0048]|uniref:glycoside hydrolase family 43 protein n=1 Tax=Paenibacillus sp. FSL R7-0048 TaxID=2954528 RepID=UPI0030FA3B64